MSKQSDAKDAQNYRREPMCCKNCEYFSSDLIDRKPKWATKYVITEEKNIRCMIGGFKVQKMGSCDNFVAKATA